MTDFEKYYEIKKEVMLSLPFGMYELSRVVSKENEPLLIRAIKKMIDEGFDSKNNFYLDFNSAYTKFRKLDNRFQN